MTFPVIADGHSLPGAPRQSRPGEAPPVSPGRAERPLSFPAERSEGKGIHPPYPRRRSSAARTASAALASAAGSRLRSTIWFLNLPFSNEG